MKKVLSIILCAALMFTLCACGGAASSLKKAPVEYVKKCAAATGEELAGRYAGSPMTVLANGIDSVTRHVAFNTVIPDTEIAVDADVYMNLEKSSVMLLGNADVGGETLDVSLCVEPELIAVGSSLLGDTFYGFDPTRLREQYEGSWIEQLGIIDEESLNSAGAAAVGATAAGAELVPDAVQLEKLRILLEESLGGLAYDIFTEKLDISGKETRAICASAEMSGEQLNDFVEQFMEITEIRDKLSQMAEQNGVELDMDELDNALDSLKSAKLTAYLAKTRLIGVKLALTLEKDGERTVNVMLHCFDGAENAVSLRCDMNGEDAVELRSVVTGPRGAYLHTLTAVAEEDGESIEAARYSAGWAADRALDVRLMAEGEELLTVSGKLEGTGDGFALSDGEITLTADGDMLTLPLELIRDSGTDWPEMDITVKNIFELNLMDIISLVGAIAQLA